MDVLYICILSNKFDLKQTIRVLHKANIVSGVILNQRSKIEWEIMPIEDPIIKIKF